MLHLKNIKKFKKLRPSPYLVQNRGSTALSLWTSGEGFQAPSLSPSPNISLPPPFPFPLSLPPPYLSLFRSSPNETRALPNYPYGRVEEKASNPLSWHLPLSFSLPPSLFPLSPPSPHPFLVFLCQFVPK